MLPVVSTTNRTLASERLTAALPPPIAGSAAAISSSTPIADQRNTAPRDAVPRRNQARHAPTATTPRGAITGTGTSGSNVTGSPSQPHPMANERAEAGEAGDDPGGRPVVGDDLRRHVEAARLEPSDLGRRPRRSSFVRRSRSTRRRSTSAAARSSASVLGGDAVGCGDGVDADVRARARVPRPRATAGSDRRRGRCRWRRRSTASGPARRRRSASRTKPGHRRSARCRPPRCPRRTSACAGRASDGGLVERRGDELGVVGEREHGDRRAVEDRQPDALAAQARRRAPRTAAARWRRTGSSTPTRRGRA